MTDITVALWGGSLVLYIVCLVYSYNVQMSLYSLGLTKGSGAAVVFGGLILNPLFLGFVIPLWILIDSKKIEKTIISKGLERPADWNLTISDLSAEMKAGKRKSIGQPELDWAREYERSLIPVGVRFPRKGDVYESLEDQPVQYMTAWAAPFTGGGDTVLLKGERVWVDNQPHENNPIGTYALAVEYKKLEERIVPHEERENPKYDGFYFHFKTVALNKTFRLVQTDFKAEGQPSDDAAADAGQ